MMMGQDVKHGNVLDFIGLSWNLQISLQIFRLCYGHLL